MTYSFKDTERRQQLRQRATQILGMKSEAKALEKSSDVLIKLYELGCEGEIKRAILDKVVGLEYSMVFMGARKKRGKVVRYSLHDQPQS